MFWGSTVFYTMELPDKKAKIIERDNKENLIYTIMMFACTFSLFHMILFIMLATSLLMYSVYLCSGG